MRYEEFNTEMDRLIQRYGSKRYPAEVCEEIWRSCSDLTHFWLKEVVTKFMSIKREGPLAHEFINASKFERSKKAHFEIENQYKQPSMFTDAQIKFLFKITNLTLTNYSRKREVMELFIPALDKIIAARDRETAHLLFLEASKLFDIDYSHTEVNVGEVGA